MAYQSDHDPVVVSFELSRNSKGPGLFQFPDYLVNDDPFCESLAAVIKDVVCLSHDTLPVNDRPSPSLLWDTVKAAI